MTQPFREENSVSVSSWVSLAERLIIVVSVLPSCHLIWTMLLSSWLGSESCLPLFHVLVADWIIRPHLLLILTAVFVAGFAWAAFAQKGGRRMLPILKILSTLVIVLALCLTAIAFAALLFPIKSRPPEVRRTETDESMCACIQHVEMPFDKRGSKVF